MKRSHLTSLMKKGAVGVLFTCELKARSTLKVADELEATEAPMSQCDQLICSSVQDQTQRHYSKPNDDEILLNPSLCFQVWNSGSSDLIHKYSQVSSAKM